MQQEERLKVVIVDDEEGVCLGAKRIIKSFSVDVSDLSTRAVFDVRTVSKGKDFFDLIEKEKIDLVFLDHKLPDISGFDILEQIVEKDHDMLAVMITAYATFESAVQATKLGAYDFMAKPFTPDELRSSLRRATVHLLLARHARKSEEERKRLRFQFISVLSHELKAPLAAIEGYINILQKRYAKISESDYHTMLGRTQVRLEGMRKLIFDLLDLTRIESGDKKRNFEEVSIENLIRSSIETVSFEAKNRGISIDLDVKKACNINADKSEIEIVINNLLSNSVKYNRDNGQVKVSLDCSDNKTVISVSDTGIGISKEDVSRLFEDFTRIKNEKTIGILGSGLGLSTIKKIAKLYGGDISVESTPDVGSTFTVELRSDIQKV
jgi:signal transduction histidine kinase